MPADLTATAAWQSVGPLTEPTTFQAKSLEVQLTDADPSSDLTQGIILRAGDRHTFPAGKTVRYRSAIGASLIAMQSAG